MSDAMRERIAALMWKTEAVDAGAPKSVALNRTQQAFKEQSPEVRGKWNKHAKAIIAALPELQGWQPIETAPKDGTEILGAWRYGGWSYQTMIWRNGWVKKFDAMSLLHPTHWMPLPAAPKGASHD